MRTPRFSAARTKASTFCDFDAATTPSPPATIRVERLPGDRKPRAIISTPDDERTLPGASASTLIGVGLPARRPAISNTEIGPDASRIWKSGKISTPIMIEPYMSGNEGNMTFMTQAHHARLE